MDRTSGTPEEVDRVERAERLRWQGFYSDRSRAIPFFSDEPDENLVEWVDGKRIPAGKALDIGCGNGRNTHYLARNGLHVTGVDLSEQALAWARERTSASVGRIAFLCGSIFDHIPAMRSLDFIYDSGCYHPPATASAR